MKKTGIVILLILCFSCTGNTIYKKPSDLIPRDSMIMLLTDMHIAASSRQVKNKLNQMDVNYMYFVYEKYKVDSLRFANSNTYYTSMIDNYDKMLKEVKQNLSKKGTVIQKELNRLDSIKNLEKDKTKRKSKQLKIDSLVKINPVKQLNNEAEEE